jgi:isopenicillin-N N-acyltransferase-like protein
LLFKILKFEGSKIYDGLSYVPVELSGSPQEIGRRRGTVYRPLIRHIAETTLPNIQGSRREELLKTARRIEEVLVATYPELVDELKGTAEGSGISYENMLMLNAWWEHPIRSDGSAYCSNVALTSSNIGPILGSTRDIGRNPHCTMMVIKPERGYYFVLTNRADQVGGARAMNERGLCIGSSNLKVKDKGWGFPRLALMRLAAQYCSNVKEALKLFQKYVEGYANAFNVLLLDITGDAAVVELTNTKMEIRRPKDGGIGCTNHLVTRELKKLEALDEGLLLNSRNRLTRIEKFLKTCNRGDGFNSIKSILQSHGKGGLCQHGGKGMLYATTAHIMIPRRGEIHISQPPGFYCQSQFIKYELFQRNEIAV